MSMVPFQEEETFNAQSDEELIAQFRLSGNTKFVGELYKRYTHLVLAVCYKYLGNREEARDTAMGVFESLFTSLRKYEVHNFKPWLFTVTRSHCTQEFRRRKKEPATIQVEENFFAEVMENSTFLHPVGEAETEARYENLQQAVNQLSPDQQQCVLLFYYENQSYQQIADTTGFSLKQVKSFIQNGKRNLRLFMENQLL